VPRRHQEISRAAGDAGHVEELAGDLLALPALVVEIAVEVGVA
jgi:hypothetical protein